MLGLFAFDRDTERLPVSMLPYTDHQCCQIVFVKMRKKIVKMREKMRQPKLSKVLLHFWAF